MSTTSTRARKAVHHVRRTHRTLKSAVPIVTTFVSLLGAVALAMEAATGEKETTSTKTTKKVFKGEGGAEAVLDEDEEYEDEEEEEVRLHYSFLAHMMTLLHYVLKAAVLLVFVALVAYLVAMGGQTVAAIILTVLVMAVIWLTELVSRRA